MSLQIPNGATFAMANGYGSPLTVTALTNATSAVATVTNTLAAGDLVEVTSGWSRINSRIVQLSAASGTSVTLSGIDTSDTTVYPPGSGVGTIRKITGLTQISQILGCTTSGGEQQFGSYQLVEADSQVEYPTVKTAQRMELTIGDDASLAGFQLLVKANDDKQPRALKVSLPSGAVILYNCSVSFNKTPSLTVNEVMACKAALSIKAEPVRY